jgi:cobalt-precorrin-5B (C1)-methyltransferase
LKMHTFFLPLYMPMERGPGGEAIFFTNRENDFMNTTMKTGYTTGTCAAAAAYAATCRILNIPVPSLVTIDLPDKNSATIAIDYCIGDSNSSSACVIKDAGDDPDVTHGQKIIATVTPAPDGDITFVAGDGVGTVTKKGLSIPPGEPAINPVPRMIIRNAVRTICTLPLCITISIPGGKKLAKKTFNPRLGIHGGLSILGTSGIVRPFSRKAIQDTIGCMISVAHNVNDLEIVLVPGNIGRRAAHATQCVATESIVEVSNDWGFALDIISNYSFRKLTLIGHPGKLAKLAENKWDTHSSVSESAFNYVLSICSLFNITLTGIDTGTVEGLFKTPELASNRSVADYIANQICLNVKNRIAGNISITTRLIDMNGTEYGRGKCE